MTNKDFSTPIIVFGPRLTYDSSHTICDNITAESIYREIVELFHAISSLDYKNIIEEISDVAFVISRKLRDIGIPIPILGVKAFRKWYHRMLTWKQIFAFLGLEFHPKYLVHGSSYSKNNNKLILGIQDALNDPLQPNDNKEYLLLLILKQQKKRYQPLNVVLDNFIKSYFLIKPDIELIWLDIIKVIARKHRTKVRNVLKSRGDI